MDVEAAQNGEKVSAIKTHSQRVVLWKLATADENVLCAFMWCVCCWCAGSLYIYAHDEMPGEQKTNLIEIHSWRWYAAKRSFFLTRSAIFFLITASSWRKASGNKMIFSHEIISQLKRIKYEALAVIKSHRHRNFMSVGSWMHFAI